MYCGDTFNFLADNMKVLHICSDYSGSKVHYNLYKSLDSRLDRQTVYAYYDSSDIPANNNFRTRNSEIVYDDILNKYLRRIYPIREEWVFYNMKKKISLSEYDCVHATTLFGDGGIAYKINKKYGTPYIVVVRSTDIIYIKKYPRLLSSYTEKIIRNASYIVFVTQVLFDSLKNMMQISRVWEDNADKMLVLPNGINDYWIDNLYKEEKRNNYRICYAGLFYKRKNILRLIEAVDLLHSDYPDLQLHIVGDNGSDEAEINRLANNIDFVHLHKRISDKDEMLDFYRSNSVFAMPSWGETFGLVYVEALTQKMRILYSKGEGVDGMFENVGVAVDPYSVESIRDGLHRILVNFDNFDGMKNINYNTFRWDYIADKYLSLYQKAIRNKF